MAGTVYSGKRRRKKRSFYDHSLLFLTILLVCFGFVMIYSTSAYSAQIKMGNASYYLKKQIQAAVLGIVLMLFVSLFDYRNFLTRLAGRINLVKIAYFIALMLQLYVLIFGDAINGAKRWISLGPLGSFQPSDFSKIAAILFVAYLVQLNPRNLDKFRGFLKVMVYIAPLLVLIALENLSTALIIGAIVVGICFVASRKKWYFFLALALLAGLVLVYIFAGEGFRAERIEIWQNVETHEKGFQILQGLYAIASGGIWGVGLGESRQKLGYIPEAQNDMIFSIICEELGLFGAIIVVLLFVLLLWRIFIISISSVDLFGGLICTGVLVHVSMQVVLNIAVVTNSIPSTGVALPFISYGGTSVLMLLLEMGMVLSVSRQIKYEK